MLPPRVREFIRKVVEKTDTGELTWTVAYENDVISTKTADFELIVRYDYDITTGNASYLLFYRSSADPVGYRFFADHDAEHDCALLRQLFDTVQSCSAQFPF